MTFTYEPEPCGPDCTCRTLLPPADETGDGTTRRGAWSGYPDDRPAQIPRAVRADDGGLAIAWVPAPPAPPTGAYAEQLIAARQRDSATPEPVKPTNQPKAPWWRRIRGARKANT